MATEGMITLKFDGLGQVTARRDRSGCYRMAIDGSSFAEIVRGGGVWVAKVYDSATGRFVRYAGMHPTLRRAAAAAADFFPESPEAVEYTLYAQQED